jgi:excinuclease UvrABC nuclease subunit
VLVGALPEGHVALAEAMSSRAGHTVELSAPVARQRAAARRTRERNAPRRSSRSSARDSGRRARHFRGRCRVSRASSACPRRRIAWCASTSPTSAADQAVAAVVASEDGRALKRLYRRMRMRTGRGPDDFA